MDQISELHQLSRSLLALPVGEEFAVTIAGQEEPPTLRINTKIASDENLKEVEVDVEASKCSDIDHHDSKTQEGCQGTADDCSRMRHEQECCKGPEELLVQVGELRRQLAALRRERAGRVDGVNEWVDEIKAAIFDDEC